MTGNLINREVLPFVLALAAFAGTALLLDAALHLADAVWIGRYLGIAGTLLILVSLQYSIRKRHIITTGNPVWLLRQHEWMAWAGSLLVLVHAGIHFNAILAWLAVWAMLITIGSGLTGKYLLARSRHRMEASRQHEWMAWAGSLLVLVHAGIHFNAILAWLAVWAMLITIGSGLTGKYLLARSRHRMEASRQQFQDEGISAGAIQERLYWDSLTFDVIKQWRVVHLPITLAFAVLATAHILSVFLFWGWR